MKCPSCNNPLPNNLTVKSEPIIYVEFTVNYRGSKFSRVSDFVGNSMIEELDDIKKPATFFTNCPHCGTKIDITCIRTDIQCFACKIEVKAVESYCEYQDTNLCLDHAVRYFWSSICKQCEFQNKCKLYKIMKDKQK